jgi:nanoRNase/pAp phosphatase (c-di-AMP/oligoRNAs hydrolase)
MSLRKRIAQNEPVVLESAPDESLLLTDHKLRQGNHAGKRASQLGEHNSKAAELYALLDTHRAERHVIVLQSFPDPDAISSALAHQMIAAEHEIVCDIVYDGVVSHHENLALVELLAIPLSRIGVHDDLSKYQGSVFVDTQGATTGLTQQLAEAHVPVLVCVDHHEPQGILQAAFMDIRTDAGATATIYTEYLDALLPLEHTAPAHTRLATALMHGIRSETFGLIRARKHDLLAAAYLAEFVDQRALEAILSIQRSRNAMEAITSALEARMVRDNYSIAGIGYVRFEDRDAIPQAADFLLTEENVHTTIVYGLVIRPDDSEAIIGSLRTRKATFNPDTFLKEALGGSQPNRYFGGGRRYAGGFEIPVGFLAGNHDEGYLQWKWRLFDEQISRRLWTKLGVVTDVRPSLLDGSRRESHV